MPIRTLSYSLIAAALIEIACAVELPSGEHSEIDSTTTAAIQEPRAATGQALSLFPPAQRDVDFRHDVLPILARRCALCHSAERSEGGLNISTRADLIRGGDSGPAVLVGQSAQSLAIQLVAGSDRDRLMPAKGPRLSAKQVGILRRWIDQGLPWDDGVSLSAASGVASLQPRRPALPEALANQSNNPVDRLLRPYFEAQNITTSAPIDDRTFARRIYRDLIGLLPKPEQLDAFEVDKGSDKRSQLVEQLLADRTNYALHWITFWNDALRNAYRGTGFIDRNRTQITAWLFAALYDNMPYDQFVRELISPSKESQGFVRGIVWRGVVNASQRREMQAAQSISQVFLGINLKCASCHDSFVDAWKLSDAYALAAVFSPEPLEVHQCEKSTGKTAAPSFLFPQLGSIDTAADAAERQRELADLITAAENGRFSRTIVNRLWDRLLGRGIIASLDNLDDEPFHADLLDWLAADLVEHDYDLQHTIRLICTSQAYQLAAVSQQAAVTGSEPFRGPLTRRMSAEQFVDAVSQLTGVWQTETKTMNKADSRGQGGQVKAIRAVLKQRQAADAALPRLRAALVDADALQTGLGRPNREQVVTRRDSLSTPLEALEFTNGQTLDRMLREGAKLWLERSLSSGELTTALYRRALGRAPSAAESNVAEHLMGSPPTAEGIQDLMWAITMLPEFQFID